MYVLYFDKYTVCYNPEIYKAVLLDFFRVFCAPMATNWLKKVGPNDSVKLAAFQALCTESDYGRLSRKDFNLEASKLTGIPVEAITPGIEAEKIINTSLLTYVEQLKAKGYRVACLSNGTQEWTLQVINESSLGYLFEEVVLSADLGFVKPSPEIYMHTLERLQLMPSEAIFVDDRQANVEAGETCGICSLLFTNTQIFKKTSRP